MLSFVSHPNLRTKFTWVEMISILGTFQYLLSLSMPINSNIPLIILSISGIILGIIKAPRYPCYKSPVVFCILAFLFSMAISSIFSVDINRSFLLSLSFFPAILLFFHIIFLFNIRLVYLMFIFLSTISFIVSTTSLIVAFLMRSSIPSLWIQAMHNTYLVVPNDLLLLSILIPFSAVIFFKNPQSIVGRFAIMSIILTFIAVAIYQSRGGLVSAIISITCITFLLRPRHVASICIMGLFFLFLMCYGHLPIISKFRNIWQSRLFVWIVAWKMFIDSPFLGHGPRTYGILYFAYIDKLKLPNYILVDHRWMPWAHNLYLELLAEQGVVGFVCLLSMMIVPMLMLHKLFRNPIGDVPILAKGIFASFISILVAAIFELSFIRHWFVIMLFSILALTHVLSQISVQENCETEDYSLKEE